MGHRNNGDGATWLLNQQGGGGGGILFGSATTANATTEWARFDGSGNLYVSDNYNQRVRKITAGETITTYAGSGLGSFCGVPGLATAACLEFPIGLAVDVLGNLYVANSNADREGSVLRVRTHPLLSGRCGQAPAVMPG